MKENSHTQENQKQEDHKTIMKDLKYPTHAEIQWQGKTQEKLKIRSS